MQFVVVSVGGHVEKVISDTCFCPRRPGHREFLNDTNTFRYVFKSREQNTDGNDDEISKNEAGVDRTVPLCAASGNVHAKQDVLQWTKDIFIPAIKALRDKHANDENLPIVDDEESHIPVAHMTHILFGDEVLPFIQDNNVGKKATLRDFLKGSHDRVCSV